MRRLAILLLLVLFALPVYAQNLTQLLVPLTNEDGTRAANITAADLMVAESGHLLKVVKVEPRDSPLRVTLAIENSRGLSQDFAQIRMGAKAFISALPQGIQVTIVSTAPVGRTVVKSTMDRGALLKGVDAISPDTGPGRFIESLVDWTQSVDKDKDKGSYTPVLVTIGSTFGDEQVRDADVKSAMNRLPALGAKVHTILYNAKTNAGGAAEAQLDVAQSAAQRTGGKFVNADNVQRIASALPELGAEVAKLQTGGQYLLTVEWPKDVSPPANLAIAISAPSGVTVGRMTLVPPKK